MLAHLIDYFTVNNIAFAPNHLYLDVHVGEVMLYYAIPRPYISHSSQSSIAHVHKSGLIHRTVMNDISKSGNHPITPHMLMPRGRYLGPNESVQALLQKLKSQGKKLFIITNSGELRPATIALLFVDAPLTHACNRVSVC